MPDAVFIELPLPAANTGGNARGHWSDVHRSRKRATLDASRVVRSEINRLRLWTQIPWERVRILIHWYGHSKPDPDNVVSRCKPYIDGLVLGELIPDDNPDHVLEVRPGTIAVDRRNKRVVLEVRRVKDEPESV